MTGFSDRVKETTSSTGTGNLTLAGAVTGYESFTSNFATNTDQISYAIEAVDANGVPTGAFEVGFGHLSGATTFVRDQVLSSSNSNALVNFAAGTKNIWCNYSAMSCVTAPMSFNLQYGLA